MKPLKIIVRCDEFKVDVLDPNKVEYLSYLNKLDLWFRNMGRDLPTKFYQYQAWVINDSPDDVEMIFLSFPATRMFVQGGRRLSLPTPGCGKVVFSFITPAAPKTERVEIVLGRSNPDWDTPDGLSKVRLAYGTLDLKMPKTNEYDYDLGLSEVPLEDVLDEAEATHPGCKS